MKKLIEIAWTEALEQQLAEWLLSEGQLPALTALDVGTPEMVAMTLRRRQRAACRAVQCLFTLLQGKSVKALDCDVIEAMARLRLARPFLE